MATPTCGQRLGWIATLAVAAAPLDALAIPLWPAIAQPYIGWDFGNGIGTSPSATRPAQSTAGGTIRIARRPLIDRAS